MGGWLASDDFHHFPSKLLIVSLQLSIQNVQMRTGEMMMHHQLTVQLYNMTIM
jgi:hypothetical protein